MDSNEGNRLRISEAEADYAELAIEELSTRGATDKRCLRCGSPYILEIKGSSYTIRCETPNCFHLTVRGM
jgi:hypothetical protein